MSDGARASTAVQPRTNIRAISHMLPSTSAAEQPIHSDDQSLPVEQLDDTVFINPLDDDEGDVDIELQEQLVPTHIVVESTDGGTEAPDIES